MKKSSNYKSQQLIDPRDTSFRSEGGSEGFLKLARAPLEEPTSRTNAASRGLKIHLDGHMLYQQAKTRRIGEINHISVPLVWFCKGVLCVPS